MKEHKIEKHKKRFKIYSIICIFLSLLITYFLFMFMYGWAKGDGQDVTFDFRAFLIFIGIAFGFYVSMILPGYLFHKILIMINRNKD